MKKKKDEPMDKVASIAWLEKLYELHPEDSVAVLTALLSAFYDGKTKIEPGMMFTITKEKTYLSLFQYSFERLSHIIIEARCRSLTIQNGLFNYSESSRINGFLEHITIGIPSFLITYFGDELFSMLEEHRRMFSEQLLIKRMNGCPKIVSMRPTIVVTV